MSVPKELLIVLSSLLLPTLALASARVPTTASPADAVVSASPTSSSFHDEGVAACGRDPTAARLAELIRQHRLQQRLQLSCSGLLADIAAAKAAEMAARDVVTHHYGVLAPNQRLRQAGYALPASYPGTINNQVEAVAGGFHSPEAALQALLDSPPHREHLLAEHPFYAEQNEIGVGYARNADTDHVAFWVVYIARRSGSPSLQASHEFTPAATSR